MVRTRFALILYFRLVAHKAACHNLSKAFLKSMNLILKLAIFLHKNIFCDPSLEPSRQDGSNEGSQHMLFLRKKQNYL